MDPHLSNACEAVPRFRQSEWRRPIRLRGRGLTLCISVVNSFAIAQTSTMIPLQKVHLDLQPWNDLPIFQTLLRVCPCCLLLLDLQATGKHNGRFNFGQLINSSRSWNYPWIWWVKWRQIGFCCLQRIQVSYHYSSLTRSTSHEVAVWWWGLFKQHKTSVIMDSYSCNSAAHLLQSCLCAHCGVMWSWLIPQLSCS